MLCYLSWSQTVDLNIHSETLSFTDEILSYCQGKDRQEIAQGLQVQVSLIECRTDVMITGKLHPDKASVLWCYLPASYILKQTENDTRIALCLLASSYLHNKINNNSCVVEILIHALLYCHDYIVDCVVTVY